MSRYNFTICAVQSQFGLALYSSSYESKILNNSLFSKLGRKHCVTSQKSVCKRSYRLQFFRTNFQLSKTQNTLQHLQFSVFVLCYLIITVQCYCCETSSIIKGISTSTSQNRRRLLFFCKLEQLKKENTKSHWWVKGWHVFDFTILCRSPSEFVGGIQNFTTLWYCDETDLTFSTGKPRNCIVYEWKRQETIKLLALQTDPCPASKQKEVKRA